MALEIQQLKEEIQSLKNEKDTEVVEKMEPKAEIAVKVPEKVKPVAEVPTKEIPVKEIKTETSVKKVDTSGVLYAQAIENGFQLVDSTPKVIYRIQKTGIADVFLIENKSAIIYKKGTDWILEYYEDNVLKQEVLNIKF